MSVMKSQKAAENSQNRKTNDHRGFIVLQTQLASFESRNYQVILDSYEAKSLCYTIHLSLTKSVRSRWLDISLVLSLRCRPQLYLGL